MGESSLGRIVGVIEGGEDLNVTPTNHKIIPGLYRESSTGSMDSLNGPTGKFDRLNAKFYVLSEENTSAPSPVYGDYAALGLPNQSSTTSSSNHQKHSRSSKTKPTKKPESSSSSSSDSSASDDTIDVNKIVKHRKRGGSLGTLDAKHKKSHHKK